MEGSAGAAAVDMGLLSPRRARNSRPVIEDKQRRKNALRACTICASRKVSCGLRRPCERCIKAGKAHLCVDVETKRRKRSDLLLAGCDADTAAELHSNDDGNVELTIPKPISPRIALFESPGVTPATINGLSMIINSSMTGDGTPGLEALLYSLRGKVDRQSCQLFDQDLDRCMNVSLWHSSIPCVRISNSSPVHGAGMRTLFVNKAALRLFGFSHAGFADFLASGHPVYWVHPESLVERLTLEKECVTRKLVSARYEGRFLNQGRDDRGILFTPFRATEIINFSFAGDGVPTSITSYFVNVRPDDVGALSPEWRAYLTNAKPLSMQALAVADRVLPACAGDLCGEDANFKQTTARVFAASPKAPFVSTTASAVIASGGSIAEVPDAIVILLEELWRLVFTVPLSKTLTRAIDECGDVPSGLQEALANLSVSLDGHAVRRLPSENTTAACVPGAGSGAGTGNCTPTTTASSEGTCVTDVTFTLGEHAFPIGADCRQSSSPPSLKRLKSDPVAAAVVAPTLHDVDVFADAGCGGAAFGSPSFAAIPPPVDVTHCDSLFGFLGGSLDVSVDELPAGDDGDAPLSSFL